MSGTGPCPGEDFAGYRIEEEIGRGGMARVYRAKRLDHTEKLVAVKVISTDLAEDEEFRQRFVREARLAAQLDHPNVLAIHEAREHDGVLFMAMQIVRGLDFGCELEEAERPLPLARAVQVCAPVADALSAAHADGLVHRDVKPGNILIRDRDQWVFLSDFGIARGADFALTSRSRVLGTPDYMAPEQARGKLDARSDLYSLGCVLFEALTGRVPYPRDTPVEAILAHVEDTPPRLRDLRPDLPAEAEALVARAMAKDPAQRYTTADELAAALRALPLEPRRAARKTEPAPRVEPEPKPQPAPEPKPDPVPRSGRRPALIGGGVVAALLAVGAIAAIGSGGGSSDNSSVAPPPPTTTTPPTTTPPTTNPPTTTPGTPVSTTITTPSGPVTASSADEIVDSFVSAVNTDNDGGLTRILSGLVTMRTLTGTYDGLPTVKDELRRTILAIDDPGMSVTSRRTSLSSGKGEMSCSYSTTYGEAGSCSFTVETSTIYGQQITGLTFSDNLSVG